MKLRLKGNKPHHGEGEHGKQSRKGGLMAGEHMPTKVGSGRAKFSGAVRGSPETHMGHAGRGGTGRIGKHDGHKGHPTGYPEHITHDAFERLGAK